MKKLTKVKNICENKKVRLAVGLLAGVAVLAWGFCVTRPSLGVIDFTAAQSKAKVYQFVIKEQNKYEEQIKLRISADSVNIEKEAKELEAQKTSMKPEEYQKKAMSLQRRFMVIQEKYRPEIERILTANQIALKGIEKEINEAIKQTTQQTGVKVLLPKNLTLDVVDKVDFTDVFVKNLDKLIQSVPYPDPTKLGG